MPSYRELLARVKSEIDEIDPRDAAEALASAVPPVLIDVREPDEFEQGAIKGAVHIPRGNLESRIEAAVPDRGDAGDPLVPVRRALGLRGQGAAGARLRARHVAGRRLLALEAERLPVGGAGRARRRAAAAATAATS